MPSPEALLGAMFDAAVASAQPAVCVPAHLPDRPKGRTVVVGAGKASAAMARAVEKHWEGPIDGVVVTRYGHDVPCDRVTILEASHPVPDAAGEAASRRIFETVSGLGENDLVLVLISGGGSALLTLPAPGLTLADKMAVNKALLASGAPIGAMNCVRKHLSAIKGGRLAAAAHPAQVVTLAISDVPGDDPAIIASGPTVPDPTTFADARSAIEAYGIELPPAVLRHLDAASEETPKQNDPCFARCETRLIATPAMALDAAVAVAREAGYRVRVLGDAIEGEAREFAAQQADLVRSAPPGTMLLSGGELTVTIRGDGRGGPNTELMLAMAMALDGAEGVWAMACDTDGIDGSEDNAGATIDSTTLRRAEAKALQPGAFLNRNDSYSFFSALGDLVVTGPTHTNVNDFRAVVAHRPHPSRRLGSRAPDRTSAFGVEFQVSSWPRLLKNSGSGVRPEIPCPLERGMHSRCGGTGQRSRNIVL